MSQFWDERFSGSGYFYGTEPNRFLAGQAHRLRPGQRALAVGDGEGRNGVWLAERGLDVLAVDSSPVGIAKAKALAEARRVAYRVETADLLDWSWPAAAFDVAVLIFIHFPPRERKLIHGALQRSLRPGGLLILECFTPAQLANRSGGPQDRAMLYTKEDLAEDFQAMEILHLGEERIELDEGPRHRGPADVVRLVATLPRPV